jgi:ubiquinone/menaquinone biosynthesis C-methylase UbiE
MKERLTQEEVHKYWTDQARKLGQDSAASWSDTRAIDLEIREIKGFLSAGDKVLDVGCANGYSTVQLGLDQKLFIRGLDYVPEMVQEARARLASIKDRTQAAIEFDVGDATALDEPTGVYDKVVVIRVLINLTTWERQVQALKECARVLKPGGLLLLSEATVQGWQRLNRLRLEWGLDEIPVPSFNLYVDQEALVASAEPELEVLETRNFSSSYFVATRVLKPLLIRALQLDLDAADPDMEWNRLASQLPSCGDYGTQKLFVFRRR